MIPTTAVCGVDCHPGDTLCNGYCVRKADHPPEIPEVMKLLYLQREAFRVLRHAEIAWYTYSAALPVGPDRVRAIDVYEMIQMVTRRPC